MAYWIEDKKLRQAKALAAKDWENPKALLQMRHLANAGATRQEIVQELGWDVCWATVTRRFKKYNITAGKNKHANRVRLGATPYHRYAISQVNYRPKSKIAST